jgi:hypothetical protein
MYLAARKHQSGNFVGGILTIYLVTTAWLTARGRKQKTSKLDWAATLVPVGIGASILINGIQRVTNPGRSMMAFPAAMNFFMATVVLLAGAGDVRMLVRGLSTTQRIARHLWRMCFGCSLHRDPYFSRGHTCSPKFLQETNILLLLGVLPLILLVFWIISLRVTKAYRGKRASTTDRRSQPDLACQAKLS